MDEEWFSEHLGLLRIKVFRRIAPYCSEFCTPDLERLVRDICRVQFIYDVRDDMLREARRDFFERHFPTRSTSQASNGSAEENREQDAYDLQR